MERFLYYPETYNLDCRQPIVNLYQEYLKLEADGWETDFVFMESISVSGKEVAIPVLAFKTPQRGPAIWLLSGIHGEEPAGPNAIANCTTYLSELTKKGTPFVLLPLCNPKGYILNWRYPKTARQDTLNQGVSVGASEQYLLSLTSPNLPRRNSPESDISLALSTYALTVARLYPPLLVIDLHEDEDVHENPLDPYIYSQGKLNHDDPVALEITKIIKEEGFVLENDGFTRFGEKIINGVVSGVNDGSIDELLSAQEIFYNGRKIPGPSAKSVVVVETPTIGVSLRKRVLAHQKVVLSLEKFWQMVHNSF